QLRRQDRVPAHRADAHGREDRGERDEGHGIRQGQHEGGEEVAEQTAIGIAVLALLELAEEDEAQAEQDQDHAADALQPLPLGDEELGDERRAERRDGSVDRVRDGGAHPRHHPRDPALRDRALDADRRDGPDRRRERESHDEPFDEEIHRARASVSYGHRGGSLELRESYPRPGGREPPEGENFCAPGTSRARLYGSKTSSISFPNSFAMRKASGRLGS